jgi:hypothetical protein
MARGNEPQAYDRTNQDLPLEVKARITAQTNPSDKLRLWNATYATRSRDCGVFLACRADFLELRRPRILHRAEIISVFGRIPGTQTPPEITPAQFVRLEELAGGAV